MACKFLSILIIIIILKAEAKPPPHVPPRLLVVSYDAFRADYFDRNVTPFLKKLKTEGTSTDYMRNVFVTKTFPNHHTISTGLFVESHGVIDSEFYDQKLNKTFWYSNELYHYNNAVIPIWTLNQNGGDNRRSGVMMWPGSNFNYNGISPTFIRSFNMSVPWNERVDEVIRWFKHPNTPINFGMMYIEEPDYHGHGIGVNSAQFNEVLNKLDHITSYLHNKLKENLLTDINVIHLSDHGMSTVTMDRIVNLTEFINPDDYISSGSSPVIHIYPHAGKGNLIYNNLKKASAKSKGFDIFLKHEIPERFHFKDNLRVGPILAVAKVGYSFQTLYKYIPMYEKEFNFTVNEKSEFGVHGYDNNATDMHPFFFGTGPAFLPECKVLPFENIDLLPLFCEILEIQCPQVNGTLNELKQCLTKHKLDAFLYNGIYFGGIVVSVIGIIVLIFVYLRRQHVKKHNAKYRILEDEAILENQLWNDRDISENTVKQYVI